MPATGNVRVSYRQFLILDGDEFPIDTGNWANGLIQVTSIGAVVHTGVDMGNVQVSIHTLDAAPDDIDWDHWDDITEWDDVMETSILSTDGDLRIGSLDYGRVPDLPSLSPQGPGSYRLRIHARGRDRHLGKVCDDPHEEYLIVSWPADARPELLVRLTDRCGYGMRLSDTKAGRRPAPFSTMPERPVERAHREDPHAAITSSTQPATSPPMKKPAQRPQPRHDPRSRH